MPDFTITMPSVDSVSLAPNPATINGAYTISIAVSENTITLYPEQILAGEFQAGEL
jgi:hypothetical protein